MTALTLQQAIKQATTDRSITGTEMLRIVAAAEQDGVLTEGERKVLQGILQQSAHALTPDAQRKLQTFLKQYSKTGDERIPTTPKAALQEVISNFKLVSQGTDTIDAVKLEAIIDSPQAANGLKAAARHLLANLSDFSNLGGSRGEGEKQAVGDKLLSLKDLSVAQEFVQMSDDRALQVMEDNFELFSKAGGGDGKFVDRTQLWAAIADPISSAEAKAAARYLLRNDALFNIADESWNNKSDGWLTKNSVTVARARVSMSDASAAEALHRDFDRADAKDVYKSKYNDGWYYTAWTYWYEGNGEVTKGELEAMIKNDTEASPEAQAAAFYALRNFDKIADGSWKVSRENVEAWKAKTGNLNLPTIDESALAPTPLATAPLPTTPEAQEAAVRLVIKEYRMFAEANGALPRKASIDKESLSMMASSTGVQDSSRSAAQYLLEKFQDFENCAGKRAGRDGIISTEDLQQMISGVGMTNVQVLKALKTHGKLIPKDNSGTFGRPELLRVAADTALPADLRAAANILLKSDALFSHIDGGASGTKDDRLSIDEVEIATILSEFTERSAAEALAVALPHLTRTARDKEGEFTRADVNRVVSDVSVPANTRVALRFALGSGLLDRLERRAVLSRNSVTMNEADIQEHIRELVKGAPGNPVAPLARPPLNTPQVIPGPIPAPVPRLPEARSTLPAVVVPVPTQPAQVAPAVQPAGQNGPARPMPAATPAKGAAPAGARREVAPDEIDIEIDNVMSDPSMTIEDRIAMILQLIMTKMDRLIEAQAKRIKEMQDSVRGKNDDEKKEIYSSIDTATMALKRLVDKRTQLFDTLRQIIDKYNQTAKSIIDSLGR